MKPIYEFEENLLERGYSFEPANEGYDIDDLNKEDRTLLSGMLYVLYKVLPSWVSRLSEDNECYGTIGKIATEWLEDARKELEQDILSEVREFSVSCLDSYKYEDVGE